MKKYRNYIIVFFAFISLCITICFIPISASRFIPAIESQVSKDLGVNIHIERLILRLGPSLKVKAPIMHIMYEDGQKFGQFDNVRFFIPWSALIKNDVVVTRLYADKLEIRTSSGDKFLSKFLETVKSKDFQEIPDISLKSYELSFSDLVLNKKYSLIGSSFETAKLVSYKNLKLKGDGAFFINDKKYLSYDISVVPNVEHSAEGNNIDFSEFVRKIEDLDFHSDIIADLKLYYNINKEVQISGLVNIDNISVLENDKKAPKSFIYLTFLGDKAGVSSNIYASADKKVYIEGIINNSKKRGLDLKVKTDEIKLSDLYTKLKPIVDLSKYKNIESIEGTLKADFTLKGNLNKIKSAGYMKINDASLSANGINVKDINSNIDFSNNIINITDAVGYVNNAPVMIKGKIDKNINLELLMNKVDLKYICPASYGVKNGIASMKAQISGTLDNIVHKENIQIDNFNCVNKTNNLSFTNLKIDTNKENIAYVSNVLVSNSKTELIKIPMLKLHIDRDTIKIPNTNVFMPNSKLTAKADITNYNNKNLSFNMVLKGFINTRDLKDINTNNAIYPIQLNINGNKLVQNLNSQIQVEKALILDEPSIINIVSKLENNSLKIDDFSISSFSGKLSDDYKQNLKGQKKLIASGNIENLANPVYKNVRIFIPQQLNLTYLDTVAQLKGDVFINGSFDKPDIAGQITVQNLINQFLQMAVNNLTIDFNKNSAVINAPQIKIADSVMSVNATTSTDFSKEFFIKNISIKSKYIDTDTFLMYKDNPLFKNSKIRINDGKLYSERVVANIYNSPLNLTALSSDFKFSDNILSLKNLSAEMYNGKLAGSADLNLREESFDSKLQARGVSASPIFNIVSTRKESVSGSMDFDTAINGDLTSKQSLNGNIKFSVHNGRMSSLGKLEHLLYAQNVIADNMLRTSLSVVTKAITLKDTGLFKYLRGDVVMKDGIAHVNLLQSQGPLMSLFVKGVYNPDTDYAKFIVLGRVSDEMVSGLGAFGDFSFNKLMIMLTGEEDKYQILPEDFDKLPQLPVKNTKEFRSIINGVVDRPSSVQLFNWISYSQKSLRQKDVPMTNTKVPEFIESLPY